MGHGTGVRTTTHDLRGRAPSHRGREKEERGSVKGSQGRMRLGVLHTPHTQTHTHSYIRVRTRTCTRLFGSVYSGVPSTRPQGS